MVKLHEEIQGTHDGDTFPDEAMPTVVGLAGTTRSNSSSDSLKLVGVDINEGSKPASLLVVHADENRAISNLASPVVGHVNENHNDRLESASPIPMVSIGESKKGEEKVDLIGGEGGGDNDVAKDSGGVARSNSKLIKISSDGDIQDDVKDAPKPMTGHDGGSSDKGGKSKDKGIVPEADHAWTERKRRKKMNDMYNTLHSLLPRLPDKADKATIVGEAADYIKTLESTIERLEKLKVERMRAQQLGAGSSVAPAPPLLRHGAPASDSRELTLADMVNNWSAQQLAALDARGSVVPSIQTWSAPNITVSVIGNTAIIGMCAARHACVLTKALCVLEKYRIDVVTMNISSELNRTMFVILARINPAATRFPENLMIPEDRYKLAVSEILQLITK
ncbi:hypothetical protein QOZ80_4AG0317440 [Eleusine coracana subsp. coracana]|nr:hypothetical protein QOZ80_4AG0317440 [Eleusine coracana subsp. coracana]